MTRLSVNLNKVALLRNSRDLDLPNVLRAARIAVEAGADGITVHPRPDERHIRPSDVCELAAALRVELNVEGNPFAEFLEIVRKLRPAQCTLVPDSPEQATSDHGWQLVERGSATAEAECLVPVLRECAALDVRSSLFLDADLEQVEAAARLGADRIELYTEPFARAFGGREQDAVLQRFADAAARAQALGLGVNAGHDLNLHNLGPFLAAVPNVLEVSIGHALIADALELGLAAAVRAYLEIVRR